MRRFRVVRTIGKRSHRSHTATGPQMNGKGIYQPRLVDFAGRQITYTLFFQKKSTLLADYTPISLWVARSPPPLRR